MTRFCQLFDKHFGSLKSVKFSLNSLIIIPHIFGIFIPSGTFNVHEISKSVCTSDLRDWFSLPLSSSA
jgi:hypothetical protein